MIAVLSFPEWRARAPVADLRHCRLARGRAGCHRQGRPCHLAALDFNRGDLVMLAAMAVWALYTALLNKRPAMHVLSFAAVTYVTASL